MLLAGPRGTSKSLAAQSKIVALCHLWPGSRHLLARKVRQDANQTTLETFEKEILTRGHPALFPPRVRNLRTVYEIDKSEVVIGGFEDPEKYKGAKFDTITFEEATEFSDEDHETAMACLRNFAGTYHQFVCVTNPGGPKHRLIERARAGKMKHLVSRHEDNPLLFNADGTITVQGTDYMATLDAMTGVTYKRQRLGLWAAAEGQVYDEWDDDLHMVAPFEIPRDWLRIRAIDFGLTHPFVCHWYAFDGDGRAFLYRQLHQTGVLVEDHAREILRLSEGERFETTVCDYEDAEGMATLERHGIEQVERANKDIESGVQAMKARLRKAKDGRPRFFVVRGSLVSPDSSLRGRAKAYSFETEIGGYVWDEKKGGETKEVPLKKEDDAMDASRYGMKWAEEFFDAAPLVATWVGGRR